MASRFTPDPAKLGVTLYPGFSNTTAPGISRLQRLETGAQRLQRGTIRPSSGTYARIPKNLLAKVGTKQVLTVTTSQVHKRGSVPAQSATNGFAYTSTPTTITWHWDGTNGSTVLLIHRSDNTNFTVPTGSITVSGLTATTTYYFLPFWNTNSQTNVGWVPGTVGTPQIAFVVADTTNITTTPVYSMIQNQQQNEPLSNGFMTAVTTTTGGGGGGAGGGGSGGSGCVMSGTEIDTLGDYEYAIEVLPETDWINLVLQDGRLLNCTFDHPLFHAVKGKIEAKTLEVGDSLITDKGEMEITNVRRFQRKCSKYKVIMKHGHLFWANGILSHNVKPAPNRGG